MKRWKKQGISSIFCIQVLALIGILLFSLICCESIFGPSDKEEEPEVVEQESASIIVYNDYGESLDIYMDGNFEFLLGHENEATISDVSHEEHTLEAKIAETNEVVSSTTIDVVSNIDYTWSIDDPPDINVINNYGQTLKISMDGIYQFDLVDEENRWIIDVPFGERFLRAIKASDGSEVASTTINITENKDYSWAIN